MVCFAPTHREAEELCSLRSRDSVRRQGPVRISVYAPQPCGSEVFMARRKKQAEDDGPVLPEGLIDQRAQAV